MQPNRIFTVIDSHTAGATTRIVTSGGPRLSGNTMQQKLQDFVENHDHIRRALMLEPRGNATMSGAFITEATTKEADLGVIFTHATGFHAMCGHGAVGVACAAVENGLVASSEPCTSLILDTPAGLIPINIDFVEGRVKRATFRNVPSFVYEKGLTVTLPEGGSTAVDVAYGGVPVILADAEAAGLDITIRSLRHIVEVGQSILEQVSGKVDLQHPETSQSMSPNLVMFSGPPTVPNARFKNAVVSNSGVVDRSPCGAATCARMAQLHAQGALSNGEEFTQEGILGTVFTGRVVGRAMVGEFDAVLPEVSARAHIIGLNRWMLQDDDPLRDGFIL